MSGTTLSDRRISSAGRAVLEQVEAAYETVFAKASARDAFFSGLNAAFLRFRKRTAKRPILPRDVKNTQRVFRDECRSVMAEAKRRIQDA
ncbi:hypothetical protein BMS3Bbin02_00008 [bacterium BMS3Bbin02]|nr:hypothetical protein BMS3Bbin02_00008 [bacterium BMS3Bbin02]